MRTGSRRLTTAIAVVASTFMLSGVVVSEAGAQTTALDPGTQAYIDAVKASSKSYDISPEVQDKLINKALAGKPLDADRGVAAVSQSTQSVDGATVTRYVYADGSVAVGSVQNPARPTTPAAAASPHSIQFCNETVNRDVHTLTNCLVKWNAATWSMDFRASYDYYQFGENLNGIVAVHVGGVGTINQIGSEIIVAHGDSATWVSGEGHAVQMITIMGMGITRSIGIRLKVNTRANPKAQEQGFGT